MKEWMGLWKLTAALGPLWPALSLHLCRYTCCPCPGRHQEGGQALPVSPISPQLPHSMSLNFTLGKGDLSTGPLTPLPWYSPCPQTPNQAHWAFNTQPSPGTPRGFILLHYILTFFLKVWKCYSVSVQYRWRGQGAKRSRALSRAPARETAGIPGWVFTASKADTSFLLHSDSLRDKPGGSLVIKWKSHRIPSWE